jgi:hypothetical protein
LERKAWTTDALIRTPDGPLPLFSEPQALPEQLPAPPAGDRDRLAAEQFEQLKADLVFTLGEMGGTAWQSVARGWQVAVGGPVMAVLAFISNWLWWAMTTTGQILQLTLQLSLRGLRFSGAVVLDFMLLVLELVDGDVRAADVPATMPESIIVPDEPRLADLAAARIRLLDRSGLPFGAADGLEDNHDFQLKQALEDIRRMSPFAQGLPMPGEGPFADMKMTDVLLTVTQYDLYACLRHLLSRPELYQGKILKLAETYALWVLQGAPRPEIPIRKR